MTNKKLYAVYKCRACGVLETGPFSSDDTRVLATQAFLRRGEKFREDKTLREDVREATVLQMVGQHECANGMVGLTDYVGMSIEPIGEEDER